ncbi:hypothetical protein [Luteirhabdus pelagi]|uniref:hypothetical protein n=1 Tax=Luteirhabdus pelagi TaxID=2792783 RepID=UPI0019399B6D|nr:hypothetical protein [Luteirhabdus pelagi]
MKKNILLKNLIDLFFIIHAIGIIGFIFILPFGVFSTNTVEVPVAGIENIQNLPTVYWIGIATSLLSYLVFLWGLFALKKTGNALLHENFFRDEIIHPLRKCGNRFVFAGGLLAASYGLFWVANMLEGNIKLTYGTNIMIPLLLLIVGLFLCYRAMHWNKEKI